MVSILLISKTKFRRNFAPINPHKVEHEKSACTLKDTTNAFLAHSLTSGESIFGVGDMFKTKFLSED